MAGDHTAQPVRGVARGPYPMPPGADMFLRDAHGDAAAERLGYHPYRAPTGVNSVPYDGRPGVQQLRVLRVLRLSDRGQGRSGRAAAARAAHRPLRDPARERSSLDDLARRDRDAAAAACATSTPTRDAHEVTRRCRRRRVRRVRDAAPAAAQRASANSSDRRRPLPDVPLPDARARATSRSGCTAHKGRDRHASHGRPDRRRRRPRTPRRATRACRTSAAASSSTAAAGTRSWRRSTRRPAPRTRARMLESTDARPDGRVHDAGRGPPAGRRTASTSTRRCATSGACRPGASPTTSHAHEVACARPLGAAARGGHARTPARTRRTGSRRRRFPGRCAPGSRTPISRHMMGTARMGTDPRDERCAIRGSGLWDVDNVVVTDSSVFPTSTGLRPDAHDRRARAPSRAPRTRLVVVGGRPRWKRCGRVDAHRVEPERLLRRTRLRDRASPR